MKALLIAIGSLLAIFILLSIVAATPLVGEVVTLHTRDAQGEWQTTPLWVVEIDGTSYLRAGTPDGSGWVERFRANPDVRLQRSGDVESVTLIEEPSKRSAVHAKMAEKYGWADGFVAIMSGDRTKALALRVEPAPASKP